MFFVCASLTDTVNPSSAFTSFNEKNSGNKHIYNMKMYHTPKLGTGFTCRFRRMLLGPKKPLWDWGTWKLAISQFFSSRMGSNHKSPPPMSWSNVNRKVCLHFFFLADSDQYWNFTWNWSFVSLGLLSAVLDLCSYSFSDVIILTFWL